MRGWSASGPVRRACTNHPRTMTIPRHKTTTDTRYLIKDAVSGLFLDLYEGGEEYCWTPRRDLAWPLRHDEALGHLRNLKAKHPRAKIIRK